MKKLLLGMFLIYTVPAYGKEVTITLTDNEQQVLKSLLDLAVKQAGLPAAESVTYFVKKIDNGTPIEPKAKE